MRRRDFFTRVAAVVTAVVAAKAPTRDTGPFSGVGSGDRVRNYLNPETRLDIQHRYNRLLSQQVERMSLARKGVVGATIHVRLPKRYQA